MLESNVTDEEIKAAFKNADFGSADHRELLQASVFKRAIDLKCGHTITCIMQSLGLIGVKTKKITKKGKRFLWHAYRPILKQSG